MDKNFQGNNVMEKISTFIVDKRKGFLLLFLVAIIFCMFSISKVSINNDITDYLPKDSETRQGLALMDKEFTTLGTAKIMITNITYHHAEKLAEELGKIEGVSSVEFNDSKDHYQSASALFDITFEGETADEISQNAMIEIKEVLSGYDLYISSEVGRSMADFLAEEMGVVLLIAFVIILSVLIFTSKTYMEIPVLLITFGVAAILNMGTNYWFKEISFVTNAIAVVLQLALAIDYAIILCHRYVEERETKEAREATIAALSKAIIEISSSSLTTISGLMALMFMQFRLGYDMGIVLIKAIIFSLISVFTLMPGLLMLFSRAMDKTKHSNLVPKINFLGRAVVKTRYIVPPLFAVLLVGAFLLSSQTEYAFSNYSVTTAKQNEAQIADKKIADTFGRDNILAIVVPTGDYESESQLLSQLSDLDHVVAATGLGNVKVTDEHVVTDKLSPRQFAELTNLDIELARLLYSAYGVDQEEYGYLISDLNDYSVPILDMFMFLYDKKEEGYVSMDKKRTSDIDKMYQQLNAAKKQLKGENYSRLLLNLDLPEEGEETFAYLSSIRNEVLEYYDEVYLVGNSVNNYDLSKSFSSDNTLISILTVLFVAVILLFTFKSAGMPVLLVLTIQGSIWINFTFQYLMNTPVMFLSYLIVSAIQMGATIDYAIVITNRYMELKQFMPIKEAIQEALNQAFPTIITSGSILASAGILIGQLSSDPTIASIGICLGRGTLISIVLVMCVLPQTLLFGDVLIEKTAFTLKADTQKKLRSGSVRLDGHIKGYVSGMIDANIKGTLKGDMNAIFESQRTQVAYLDEDEPSILSTQKEGE